MEIYIVKHLVNKESETAYINQIIGVFDSLDKANNLVADIMDGVNKWRSPYFSDNEFGWLDPLLIEDEGQPSEGHPRLRRVTYEFIDPLIGGKTYSHFAIFKYEVK